MRPSPMRPSALFSTLSLLVGSLLLASPVQAYWMRDCHARPSTWKGTTEMVADINPGPAGSSHPILGFSSINSLMTEFNNTLYFQADDGTHGSELWRVGNGAPSMVVDLVPGPSGSAPHSFAPYNGALFFAAHSSANHDALYMSNGSAIAIAVDPMSAAQNVEITALTVYAGKLYFVRYADGVPSLWRYDGTSAQAVAAANAVPGRIETSDLIAHPFVVFKNRLYFVKATGADYRLWAFDGSTMTLVKQLVPTGNFTTYGFDLGVYGDALYFGVLVPADPLYVSDELWKYSGSGAPTKVAFLQANAWSFSQPLEFTVFKGKLYFTTGSGLQRYDGSTLQSLGGAAGGAPWGAGGLTPYTGSFLYLSGFYDDWQNSEPYIFNGSTTSLLRDIMPATGLPEPGSFPTRGVQVDDMLFFSAADDTHGRELWRVKRDEGPAFLDCDIVVIPIWDDWRLWVVDEREVIVATWLAGPDRQPQLISRERTVARRDQPLRVQVLKTDARRDRLPDGARLVTRVYDAKTGAVVDRGEGSIGASTESAGRRERAAASQVGEPTLRQVMGQRVRGL